MIDDNKFPIHLQPVEEIVPRKAQIPKVLLICALVPCVQCNIEQVLRGEDRQDRLVTF